jgi:hypothetical protein
MTPLFPTTREHLTAVVGAHPFAKTVYALATAIVRLIRPLHNVPFGEE